MFKSLHIYEFKYLTKNGRNEPEKPSPQKDKKPQRSDGGGPLNCMGGPLNFKGTGPLIKGTGTLQNSSFWPFKYWFIPQNFLTSCTPKPSVLNLFSLLLYPLIIYILILVSK